MSKKIQRRWVSTDQEETCTVYVTPEGQRSLKLELNLPYDTWERLQRMEVCAGYQMEVVIPEMVRVLLAGSK